MSPLLESRQADLNSGVFDLMNAAHCTNLYNLAGVILTTEIWLVNKTTMELWRLSNFKI